MSKSVINLEAQTDALAEIQIDPNNDEIHPRTCTVEVENIHTIETLETHLVCLKCSRKVLQASGLVVRCDRCGYTMRKSKCSKRLFATIVVKAEEKLINLKLFDDVLQGFFGDYQIMTEEQITEGLLLADNIRLTYNLDTHIVTKMASI